jgi:predicted DCC family thiol-disulfide oxidoreductase YuxK
MLAIYRESRGFMPLNNGWTGGQYSIFRALFGTCLLVHFSRLIPRGAELFSNRGVIPQTSASPLTYLFPNVIAVYDSPAFVTLLLSIAVALSVFLVVGFYDRVAAIALCYIWACLFARNPLIANPGLPYVGLLLLAHACMPRAPYGSWERRNQPDPGTAWAMPQSIYVVVWILMALGYGYSGYTRLMSPSWVSGAAIAHVLSSPLARPGLVRDLALATPGSLLRLATWCVLAIELSFAPLALVRRLRPWVWALMLALHFGLITLTGFADSSLGMVMLHLFTFDPRWIKPRSASALEMIFYDGACGLCHRAVRFVLAEDRSGVFRFAPLDSEAFRAAVPEADRASLPDSIVVRTSEDKLLVRSAALLYVFELLGGVWRLISILAQVVPTTLKDYLYDRIAGVRYRLFATPVEVCPIIPKDLRARFDL